MSDLVIHGFPLSTYVRTARMACVEKGVAYHLDPLPPGETRERDLHPFGKIPALSHGDLRLFETFAIVRYIDEAFEGPPLQPSEAVDRARMTQWISAINDTIYDAMIRRCVLQYAFPKGPDGQPDRAVIEPAAVETGAQIAILEAAYGGGPYLLGAELSLADLFLAPILFYLRQTPEGAAQLAKAPKVARGYEALAARRSFRETEPPPPPTAGT